jgi:hypothetical protein
MKGLLVATDRESTQKKIIKIGNMSSIQKKKRQGESFLPLTPSVSIYNAYRFSAFVS